MHAFTVEPTIDRVQALFRRGAVLVEAAVAALELMQSALDAARAHAIANAELDAELAALARIAAVDGDNLLVATRNPQRLSTIFALARNAGGSMRVQTIEIDRDAVCLMRSDGNGVLDALVRAVGDGEDRARALLAVRSRLATVLSSLSVVKTRLDLQASFMTAVLEPETPAMPMVLDFGFDQTAIRQMALAARTQLDRQSISLSARNRRTLEALFRTAVPARLTP